MPDAFRLLTEEDAMSELSVWQKERASLVLPTMRRARV
jgi:hypothetical protein